MKHFSWCRLLKTAFVILSSFSKWVIESGSIQWELIDHTLNARVQFSGSYRRKLMSLLLCLCDVFPALIISLVCWLGNRFRSLIGCYIFSPRSISGLTWSALSDQWNRRDSLLSPLLQPRTLSIPGGKASKRNFSLFLCLCLSVSVCLSVSPPPVSYTHLTLPTIDDV